MVGNRHLRSCLCWLDTTLRCLPMSRRCPYAHCARALLSLLFLVPLGTLLFALNVRHVCLLYRRRARRRKCHASLALARHKSPFTPSPAYTARYYMPTACQVPRDVKPGPHPTRRYTENQFDSEFINVLREVRLQAAATGARK